MVTDSGEYPNKKFKALITARFSRHFKIIKFVLVNDTVQSPATFQKNSELLIKLTL